MRSVRKILTAATLSSLLVGAAPASAHGGEWRRHHDPDRLTAGEAVGAVALIGLAALIAGSKKSKPAIVRRSVEPLAGYEGTEGGVAVDPREAAAVDACIDYVGRHFAEDEDSRGGRVEQIVAVMPRGDGGYKVRGMVRVNGLSGAGELRKFRCSTNARNDSRTLVIG